MVHGRRRLSGAVGLDAVTPPVEGSRPVARLVAAAVRDVQILSASTPLDVRRERARLVGALRGGRPMLPRWEYASRCLDDLRSALEAAERALARSTRDLAESTGAVWLQRVRELSLEAALCAAAGTREFGRLARERFAASDKAAEHAASALCARWLSAPLRDDHAVATASDSPDARSLLSRMRAAVGHLRLPFSVVVHPTLAPLAATGEGVILVAAGRPVCDEDAARTVLHETEGHARPRARALRAGHPLFRWGTARGSDDQEGRALLVEERAGMLGPRRRRQLAARHRAVEAMLGGADFAEVTRSLVREHGLDALEAVVVAERAFRGGDGTFPGLGRERVYLDAFVRVRAHLAAHPDDEEVLASGQVALDAIAVLRPFTRAGEREQPVSRPVSPEHLSTRPRAGARRSPPVQ
jgi:hypothetical protein